MSDKEEKTLTYACICQECYCHSIVTKQNTICEDCQNEKHDLT